MVNAYFITYLLGLVGAGIWVTKKPMYHDTTTLQIMYQMTNVYNPTSCAVDFVTCFAATHCCDNPATPYGSKTTSTLKNVRTE